MEKYHDIETGILPLVEALNRTGYFKTMSSCEGHFDRQDNSQESANVRCYLVDGVQEKDLESYFLLLLQNFYNSLDWSSSFLNIYKQYVLIPGSDSLTIIYIFEIETYSNETRINKKKNISNGTKLLSNIINEIIEYQEGLKHNKELNQC